MHVVTVLVEVCTRFVRSVVLVNDAHVCTAFSWRFSGRAFVHVLGVGAGYIGTRTPHSPATTEIIRKYSNWFQTRRRNTTRAKCTVGS